MKRTLVETSAAVVFLLGLAASPAVAQFPPDSFTNLKVLPEDIETRALINTMRGFALGLGVRCQFCHVGEEGMPLAEFDFPADEKSSKLKAREMLRMVEAINDRHLATLEERSDPPVVVTCATCHRGQSKPLMIEDVLSQVIAERGIDSARAHYRKLREEYYGSYTYDFTERPLNRLAQDLAEQQRVDDAIGILQLNEEFYPESGVIQYMMGEAYLASGNREEAIRRLERALELNPDIPPARRRLEQLKNP